MHIEIVVQDNARFQLEKLLRKLIARHTSELMMYNKGIDKQKDLYRFIYDRIKGRRRLYNLLDEKTE